MSYDREINILLGTKTSNTDIEAQYLQNYDLGSDTERNYMSVVTMSIGCLYLVVVWYYLLMRNKCT